MSDENRNEMILRFLETTHKRTITSGIALTWQGALSKIPTDQLAHVFTEWIRSTGDEPTIHDVMKLCGVVALDEDARAVEAWGLVIKAMRVASGYGTVDFTDGAIPATIRAIGHNWVTISGLEYDELKWVRKDFLTAYPIAASGIGDASPMMGITGDNGRVIGNRHKVTSSGEPTAGAKRLPRREIRSLPAPKETRELVKSLEIPIQEGEAGPKPACVPGQSQWDNKRQAMLESLGRFGAVRQQMKSSDNKPDSSSEAT